MMLQLKELRRMEVGQSIIFERSGEFVKTSKGFRKSFGGYFYKQSEIIERYGNESYDIY